MLRSKINQNRYKEKNFNTKKKKKKKCRVFIHQQREFLHTYDPKNKRSLKERVTIKKLI